MKITLINNKMLERFRVWILAALITFLPLSAWLVSFGGTDLIGLGRDILLGGFLAISILTARPRRPSVLTWLAVIFILLTLITFWFRQDSIAQWLRGVRYLTEPFILFIGLQLWPLRSGERLLWRSLAVAVSVVTIAALLELFSPDLVRLTLNEYGRGYVKQINFAGTLPRLQATLAGPNALGLFLMMSLLLWPIWQRTFARPIALAVGLGGLAALLLSVSRSSYLGFFVGTVVLLLIGRGTLKNPVRPLLFGLLVLSVLVGAMLVFRPQELRRVGSDSQRLIEYRRIWASRDEIGFWGRGAGSSGLVSQYRIDDGPNYFTENTYLDIYEAVGIPAALVYLAFWLVLARGLLVCRTLESATVGAAVIGLVVAGFFINQYTGQAAIWLTLMLASLAVVRQSKLLTGSGANRQELD